MRRLSSLVLVALAASAATATSALASPSTSTYGGNANGVQGTLHSAAKVSGGTLPFTGANLAAILGAALLLVVVGAVLRRRASQ